MLRVEAFLRAQGGRAPFRVLVDHRSGADSLASVAFLHGWRLEIEERDGDWCVRFLPTDSRR